SDAVSAALAYRAQAPVLDGLMKELGLDGSSLGTLVSAAAAEDPANDGVGAPLIADQGEDDLPTDEAAE
ncbi:MAG: flotillin family protein, partial [Pseudomonadota bacterium]